VWGEEARVTDDPRAVLNLLSLGWRLRVRRGNWRLKQPGYVSSFEDCPGGKATIDQLRSLGYIDDRNNITEAGEKERLKQ
jgi:hypothetical protein